MMELREQIAKRLEVRFGHWYQDDIEVMDKMRDEAGRVLALIPKPTVTLVCDKCGGSGLADYITPYPDEYTDNPCTCNDGKVEHEIVWRVPADHEGATGFDKVLELPDLLDADVAWAYAALSFSNGALPANVPENKGTLRIGLVVKEDV